ncbi:Endoglucanase-4 [Paramyrothecium foliicola]|nr:Endoglucanase-4 [Paramyrothecium foliicola]
MSFATRNVFTALAGAAAVAAHGHVQNIIVGGVQYPGYDVTSMAYMADPPTVVGWSTTATDNGFVAPDAFDSADIICHRDAKNAGGHAQVKAGDSIFLQWDTWPDSHKGPIIDYLASCGDAGCETVDKTALEFFKISEKGLIDGSASPGTYADSELLKNGNGWLVKIPETIAPGAYVLRHEIIALHSGGQENGAQAYPQCFNLEVTGSGTEKPAGVKGTELYKPDDEGILFNIYTPLDSYPIPGPALIPGASAVAQSVVRAESTGTPTVGSGSGSGPAPTAPAASSAPAEPAPTQAPSSSAAPAPASTSAASPPAASTTEAAAPQPTESVPEEPTTPPTCNKKKRSKKVRRHARDVKARNVAPIRVAPVRG